MKKKIKKNRKKEAKKRSVQNINDIEKNRTGGQNALRGYSYQLLYSCFTIISNNDEKIFFKLEGIEDIDRIDQFEDSNDIHIQLKYSINKQDASFLPEVLKNFLEVYLVNSNKKFKLVYDFPVARGNLNDIFNSNLTEKSYDYWKNVVLNIKKDNSTWNWVSFDFDKFISHISFENKEKKILIDEIEKVLINKYDITTDNISLFVNGLQVFCLEKMKERGLVSKNDIDKLIASIKDDISKGYQNPAHSWIEKISFSASNLDDDSFFEGKKATPSDIVNGMPVRRNELENKIKRSIQENLVTVIKSSSGQGKTTLALQVAYLLKKEYTSYQLSWCNRIDELKHIVNYFKTRIQLGEKLLILIDNLDNRTRSWNNFVQYLQNELVGNYKILITTREMDWYNYSGDLSNIHSIEIIKPSLEEKEAKEIYEKFLAVKKIHSNVKNWREAWNKIADRKLLIEYVYLITHGEMLSERINSQIKEISNSESGKFKCDILRKVCFADMCGARLSITKLYEFHLEDSKVDFGEVLRSLNDEFLIREKNGYVEGLHPVRSMHMSEVLHEFYPIDTTALTVIKMLDKDDYLEVFSHLQEFNFNENDFFEKIVEYFFDQEDLSNYMLAIKGLFSGGVLQYYRNNKEMFDDAQQHRGLFLISMEMCPFVNFEEFNVQMSTLDNMKEILPDNQNIDYLCKLRDDFPKCDLQKMYVYSFCKCLYRKMKDLNISDVEDLRNYIIIGEWLYTIDIQFNLSLKYTMSYIWDNLHKISFEVFTKYMYLSFLGNKDDYFGFFDENKKRILTYIKHETNSLRIYTNQNEIHLEYLLDLNKIQNANKESVSRLQLLCKALPIYDYYCSDAIKPSLDILSGYKIPDDAHKKMPIENVIITFHQEINKLWNDTVLSNYEFDTVEEWVEYWEKVRRIICNLMDNGCDLIDKILGEKNLKTTANEWDKIYHQYKILLINGRGYPKENKPFEKIKSSPKGFSNIKNNYFNVLENMMDSFIEFIIKKNKEQQRMFLLNLRKVQSNYLTMQKYFKDNNWISDASNNLKLCLYEKEIINKFAMYCHYYDNHKPDSRYNKYHVREWFEDLLNKDNETIQNQLKALNEIYHVHFPRKPYYIDILSYYPIIIENFDQSKEENYFNFIERSLSFGESKYDYMVLLTSNTKYIVSQQAVRFPKKIFNEITKNKEIISQPFPEEVTTQMLECFDENFVIEVNDESNKQNKFDISFIAQKLWQYSKLMRILVDEEDKDYLAENLAQLRKDITRMLLEAKYIIPYENMKNLKNTCNSVFEGEEFDDYSLNQMIKDAIQLV